MDNQEVKKSSSRHNRTICVPFSQDEYLTIVNDANAFSAVLDPMRTCDPDLFPVEMTTGDQMKELKHSKKRSLPIRRIKVAGISDTVRPSFVMPSITGLVTDVEKALFFRTFGVP